MNEPSDQASANLAAIATINEIAGFLRAAGLHLYLREEMAGAAFTDNYIRGLQPVNVLNLQEWSLRPEIDGTVSVSVALQGHEHGLYRRRYDDDAWLVDGYQTDPDPRLLSEMEKRLGQILVSAGLNVNHVMAQGWDNGFGTGDVHFTINYRPRPLSPAD
jgi:hypothetical protein